MDWGDHDQGSKRHHNAYGNNYYHGPDSSDHNRAFQKRSTYIRTNKRRKSNSPPNSRSRLNFMDYGRIDEDQDRDSPIKVVIENLDIECLNENLDMDKIRMSPMSKKQTTASDLDSEFAIDYNLKKFFQSRKDLFVPYNFIEEYQSQQHNFTGELRGYIERNALYKIRKVPRPTIKTLLPNEPHIKLTVLRTNLENNVTLEYFITPRGMLNSNRNTDHTDVVIGRQQSTPDGIIPNDICLFYTDRATSRVHCKLVTKYGFKVPREIPENFMTFLMASHKRAGVKSPASKLYKGLYRYIFSFIKEPRKFWLADLGSVFGTYVKLNSTITYPLEKGQTYLVGLDTLFNIVDVNNGGRNKKKYKGDSAGYHSEAAENEEFMKFLLQEKIYNKCDIHGLSETEENILEQMLVNHKATLYEDDNIFDETATSEFCFERAYLKLEIQNCRGIHTSPNHLFVANSASEFVLGRMQGCDINLNLNTISRKQSRFVYSGEAWYISDGVQAKESANGTWISLTDYRMKRERTESEPRAIEHGDEIKISDTILKVEVFNNH